MTTQTLGPPRPLAGACCGVLKRGYCTGEAWWLVSGGKPDGGAHCQTRACLTHLGRAVERAARYGVVRVVDERPDPARHAHMLRVVQDGLMFCWAHGKALLSCTDEEHPEPSEVAR